jgi:hypothetical protein
VIGSRLLEEINNHGSIWCKDLKTLVKAAIQANTGELLMWISRRREGELRVHETKGGKGTYEKISTLGTTT